MPLPLLDGRARLCEAIGKAVFGALTDSFLYSGSPIGPRRAATRGETSGSGVEGLCKGWINPSEYGTSTAECVPTEYDMSTADTGRTVPGTENNDRTTVNSAYKRPKLSTEATSTGDVAAVCEDISEATLAHMSPHQQHLSLLMDAIKDLSGHGQQQVQVTPQTVVQVLCRALLHPQVLDKCADALVGTPARNNNHCDISYPSVKN